MTVHQASQNPITPLNQPCVPRSKDGIAEPRLDRVIKGDAIIVILIHPRGRYARERAVEGGEGGGQTIQGGVRRVATVWA